MTTAIRNCTFAFKCDKKWEDLKSTADADIRFCGACQLDVYFCHTDAQLREDIVLNRCVTIEFVDPTGKHLPTLGVPASDFDDELPF